MKRIEQLRAYLYQRKLQQQLAAPAKRRITRLAKAKSVAICFAADNLKDRKQVLAYADRLRKQGKRVTLLAYLAITDKEATYDFAHYSKRDIAWGGFPKGPAIEKFTSQTYDAFIGLFTQTNAHLEFLSATVQASLRIGPRPAQSAANYDLMIDAPTNMSLAEFIQYYEQIFAKSAQAMLQEA